MADRRMLNQRQMEMMSGLTNTPMPQAQQSGIPAEYNASMDAMSRALEDRAMKEQLMQRANQQAQGEMGALTDREAARFQGLRQRFQAPPPVQGQMGSLTDREAASFQGPQGSIELSQDPAEMERQINAARLRQR